MARSESSRCGVVVAVFMCAVCLGGGIAIGYFAINRPKHTDDVVIPEYQKSCNDRCTKEGGLAASCNPPLPRHYVAHHLNGKTINVDGRLDDDAWNDVPWTEDFMDIRGPSYPTPPVLTRAKIRWDDEAVYVGAYLEEPHVWATYTTKDSRIYEENAFEIFFDVDNSMSIMFVLPEQFEKVLEKQKEARYKEIEINALGTTWDLMLTRAYMDGGSYFDWEGIREKGVYTDGAVNNASVPASFWSIEMSFPFVNLNENTTRSVVTPTDGEMWFMILARPRYDLEVLPNNTYRQKPGTGASWYSWTPTGAINLHLPSKWGLLFFETDAPTPTKPVVTTKRWLIYRALFDVFNALKSFKAQRGTYVDRLSELELPIYITAIADNVSCLKSVKIELMGSGFKVTVESKAEPGVMAYIDEDRHVTFSS